MQQSAIVMRVGGPAAGYGRWRGVLCVIPLVVEGHCLEAIGSLLHERTAADLILLEKLGAGLPGLI
jgi:hypothetical protein